MSDGRDSETDGGRIRRVLRAVTPTFLRRNYARKFIAAFLLVVILVAVIGALNLSQIRETSQREAREELHSEAAFHASLQNQWVASMKTETQLVSGYITPWSLRGRFSTLSMSDAPWQASRSIVAVHYVNVSQQRLVSSTELNHSNRALGTVDAPWTGVIDGVDLSEYRNSTVWVTDDSYLHDGQRVVGFVSPSPKKGAAVVVVGSNQPVLEEIEGSAERTTVLNADGERVFGAAFESSETSREGFRRARDSGAVQLVDDGERLRAYVPARETDWVVVTSARKASVFEAARAVEENLLWTVFTTVVLLIGLGLVFGRHTVVPLTELREGTRQIAEGNFDIDLSTTRIDEIGRLYDDFARMRDELQRRISEIEEHEAELEALTTRFQLALEETDTGVWEWHPQTDEVIWDEASERLFGFEPGEFPGTYQAFLDRVHPDDVEKVERRIDEALAAGEEYRADFRVRLPDGTQRWIDARGVLKDGGDEPRRMLGVQTDITERKERERELEAYREDLEQSNEKLEQFAGVVSHDLRNPLTVISGRIEYLREGDQSDVDEHLDSIERSAERMQDIIDDLLALSRIGSEEADMQWVSLARAATDGWESVQTSGADLDLRVPGTATIRADRDQLLHVFENLFRNAREHNEPPVTVSVGLLESESAAEDAVAGFYVEDDGDGIPDDERTEVFEHGYTTNTDGTGFGLSIVDEIADVHDWNVTIEDSEAGGARFEISTDSEAGDAKGSS